MLEIREDEWPWVFAKGKKPEIIIATLEALAILVARELYYGREPDERQSRVTVVPSLTDNRGNGALLNKLMTTKFPASAVLMELAVFMKKEEPANDRGMGTPVWQQGGRPLGQRRQHRI